MSDFTARFERLELKFVIDEEQARYVRRSIAPYCQPDKHSQLPARDRGGNAGYEISSLYLDTPGLAFHRAKERGDPDRIKLRVRTYSPTSTATLEIKRRRSDIIDKTRGVVDRWLVERAASGMLDEASSSPFFQDFASVVATSGASPRLTVRYEREAYESIVDEYARVTFDRRIRTVPTTNWDLCPPSDGWHSFDNHWRTGHHTTPIVLEIKCQTDSVPFWVIDLIRQNSLIRSSFSKYSIGIHLMNLYTGTRIGRSRSAQSLG